MRVGQRARVRVDAFPNQRLDGHIDSFQRGIGSNFALLPPENAIGLARLKAWNALSFLFGGRRAVWYSITDRRVTHPEEFKADMAALFDLLREGAVHPVVVDRLPIKAAREVHSRIDAGGLGGKIVLLPWPEPE